MEFFILRLIIIIIILYKRSVYIGFIVSDVGVNLDKAALDAVQNACPFSYGLNDSINMDVSIY